METTPRNGDSVETLLKKILLVVGDTSSSTSWGDIIGTITAQGDLTTYVQEQIAAALTSVVKKQGGIDCSTNPNFPAASNADLYFVTVAGKIGGVNGPAVSIGDTAIAIADTVAGDFATVGQNWIVLNTNIPGLSTLGVLFATMNAPASDSFVKVKSDNTIELVPEGDIGGGGAYYGNQIDIPPTSPTIYDDEFTNSNTLPGGASPKWRWWSVDAAKTRNKSVSIVDSCMKLVGNYGSHVYFDALISTNSIPVDKSFEVIAKLNLSPATLGANPQNPQYYSWTSQLGICLTRANASYYNKGVYFAVAWANNAPILVYGNYTEGEAGYFSNYGSGSGIRLPYGNEDPIYIKLKYDTVANTTTAYVALGNGTNFREVFSQPDHYTGAPSPIPGGWSYGADPNIHPAYVGVIHYPGATTDAASLAAIVDWVRVRILN